MARAPSNATKRTRVKAELAPTTPDPIEIAMEAEASGKAPQGAANRVGAPVRPSVPPLMVTRYLSP